MRLAVCYLTGAGRTDVLTVYSSLVHLCPVVGLVPQVPPLRPPLLSHVVFGHSDSMFALVQYQSCAIGYWR